MIQQKNIYLFQGLMIYLQVNLKYQLEVIAERAKISLNLVDSDAIETLS